MITLPGGLTLDDAQQARADELHRRAIVIDGSAVIYREDSSTQFRYDRYTVGGCTAVNSTVCDPDLGFEDAITQIARERAFIASNPDHLLLVESVEDILAAKERNIGGVIFGPQDSLFLGNDIERLQVVYDLGVRIIQLTYQRRNTVGDGCGEPQAAKLSRFGVDVVEAMNDMGVLVDLAHTSHETSFDAIAHSSKPVILSHAHPAALTPTVRAKSDDLLKAVADSGGVVGPTAISYFVLEGPGRRPTVRDYVEHIEYLVNLIGIDHVSIGLDYDETKSERDEEEASRSRPELAVLHTQYTWEEHLLDGLSGPDQIPNITRALVASGYSDDSILKILGGNLMRVFSQTWN